MATIAEVEKLALDLPETERAALAAHLLGSLPSVLHDEDEGIAEALRRDAEFEANSSLGYFFPALQVPEPQRLVSRSRDRTWPSAVTGTALTEFVWPLRVRSVWLMSRSSCQFS
jgi:hypothetical protein